MVEIEITRLSSKGQIVIPLEMRKGLKEGDKMIVVKKDDEIILKKSISEDAILSEKSLSRSWMNKKEDKAWKDL